MSVKALVRNAALKAAGYVEIPVGNKIGTTPERERAALIRIGMRPVWYPDDPRHSGFYFMCRGGGREATPEEATYFLKLDKERLERAGLTFAEPGDPDGFAVKWKGRAGGRERAEAVLAQLIKDAQGIGDDVANRQHLPRQSGLEVDHA